MGVEPIAVGFITGRQWLVLVWLCNLALILLRSQTQQQTKSPLSHKIFSYGKWHVRGAMSAFETHNTYFWAIWFLAVVWGLLAYVLGWHDTLGNLALGLTTAWVVYWIVASAIHGIKNTWMHTLGKIFGLLIIAWAGRVVLGSNNGQSLLTDIPQIFTNLISVPKAAAPSTTSGDTADITSGANNLTDIPAANSWNTQDTSNNENTSRVTNWDTTSENTGWENTTSSSESSKNTANPNKDATKALSFAQVVPAIVNTYGLSAAGPDVKFTNIPRTSDLYTAFKAWYSSRFYGLGVNPQNIVSCNVYFVMLGIAQKWNVQYTPSTIFSAHAAEATKRGQTFGCVSWKNVTEANLPW